MCIKIGPRQGTTEGRPGSTIGKGLPGMGDEEPVKGGGGGPGDTEPTTHKPEDTNTKPPEIPTTESQAGTEAVIYETMLRRRRKELGRMRTILTSPLGLTNPAPVAKKTLLGR